MRTLTLGVLIVSGGTLAALPFRRYQAIPDASVTPAAVSGPTQSVLDDPSLPSAVSSAAASSLAQSSLDALPEWNRSTVPPPPRAIDIPLTYEDLATPIDQPDVIENRFNAIATVRDKELERQTAAGMVMPELESLAFAQQQSLQLAAESAPRAGGRLASSLPAAPVAEQLPKPDPVQRRHHWIRQPD